MLSGLSGLFGFQFGTHGEVLRRDVLRRTEWRVPAFFASLGISSPRCHIRHHVMLDQDTSVLDAISRAVLLRPSHCPPDLSESPTIAAHWCKRKKRRFPSAVTMIVFVSSDLTQLSIYDPTPSTVQVISNLSPKTSCPRPERRT